MHTRKTWSTITVLEQLFLLSAAFLWRYHTICHSRLEKGVRREGTELCRRSTLFVPRLSLGLIQYKSTRPIVAYLFYVENVNGTHFSLRYRTHKDIYREYYGICRSDKPRMEGPHSHHVLCPFHANCTCVTLRNRAYNTGRNKTHLIPNRQ